MRRRIKFILLLFFLSHQGFSQSGLVLEPGFFLMPQKTWFLGTQTVESFQVAVGANLGLKFSERHGFQISTIVSQQTGVRVVLPCEYDIPPCPPTVKTAYYFKLPFLYRYMVFLNEVVIIKLLAGPQVSAYVYPSDTRHYYNPATVDFVGAFEMCHQLSGNIYFNYGFRFDRSLTKPVKGDVLTEFGNPILSSDAPNANMTLGLVLGIDFLMDRKFRHKRKLRPGAHGG